MSTQLLFALIGSLVSTAPPFQARFEQVTIDGGQTDTVRGYIYFAAPWRIYYQVDYPLKQNLSVVMNTTTIYYPDKSLAYVIKAKSEVESPLSQQSLGAVDPSQAMAKMGLAPGKTRVSGDTTYSTWNSKNKRLPFSHVVFGHVGRATVYVEVLRRNGGPLMRIRFSNHIKVDTVALPTAVVTERFDTEGERTLETLTYQDVDTSTAFLRTLGRFTLPTGTRIKTSNW